MYCTLHPCVDASVHVFWKDGLVKKRERKFVDLGIIGAWHSHTHAIEEFFHQYTKDFPVLSMRRGEYCVWPEFKLFINLIYGRGRLGRVEQSWRHSPDSLTSWIFVIVPSRSAIKDRGVFGLVPPLEPWHAKYYAFISSVRLCGMLAGATDAVQAMQEFLHLSPLILACSEDWRPALKHLWKFHQS